MTLKTNQPKVYELRSMALNNMGYKVLMAVRRRNIKRSILIGMKWGRTIRQISQKETELKIIDLF